MVSCTDVDVSYRDIVNDVVVQPGTHGRTLLANVAWRSGASYNGFYRAPTPARPRRRSTPAVRSTPRTSATRHSSTRPTGPSCMSCSSPHVSSAPARPAPWQVSTCRARRRGRAVHPHRQHHDTSPRAGRPNASSASAAGTSPVSRPGTTSSSASIRRTPTTSTSVSRRSTRRANGGATWQPRAATGTSASPAGAYLDANNTCDGNVVHPDQHAIAFDRYRRDGLRGQRRRDLPAPGRRSQRASWKSLQRPDTATPLQYYSVGVGKDHAGGGVQVWGGLQDNGVSLLDPKNGGAMVSPFGGDGGQELVDPNNGCRAVGEYVNLTLPA